MTGPPSPGEVVEFVLGIPPETNAYQATANYVTVLLQPCPLPTWSYYLDHFFAVIYFMTAFLAFYIIYIRTRTTRFFFFRLNTLGLIWIDRAFHCGSCYVVHSAVAIAEIISRDFVLAGRLNQTCTNLLLGIKGVIVLTSTWGFLWMCICHRAFLQWGPIGISSNRSKHYMPFNLAPIMNACFVFALMWTIVPVTWAFARLTVEYISLDRSSRRVIRQLLDSALTYPPSTNDSLKVLNIMTPLAEAIKHTSRIVHYTRLGSTFYMTNTIILVFIYVPFLILIARDLRHKKDRDLILRRQQEQMLMQAILHITMSSLTIPILRYMLQFPGDTFVYDPRYWLALRMGLHGPMAVAGFVALFLIYRSMHETRSFHNRNGVADIGLRELMKEEI
ncbi:hypothetical protein DFH28DRAFT_961073 [Melampsora americana]|nr:hypothetical protein DFH28DRAFT_961073 [Melampsora americana]